VVEFFYGKVTTASIWSFLLGTRRQNSLRLLNLLRDGEVCVCFFAGTLGTNNPKISRHLSYLNGLRW
jgi:hypothetical protein